MSNSLEVVALTMGEVVHGIGVPLIARTDMWDIEHTIDQRVTEQHVGVSHVDLCAQHQCTGLALAAVHKLEQLQVLLDRTITERTVCTWTGGRSLLLGNNLRTLFVNIGTALFDKPYGKVPELLKVVTGIIHIGPLESEPLDIVLDTLDIFRIFLDRVGVVETEIAGAAIFLGQTEVDGDSLGMTDVQIAIGLWWKTRL